jgi:leucyl/phenylalanyl-tRNA--protein transferase
MIPISTLLGAYRAGYFPMAVEGEIRWFSPERRGVIPLDRFRTSRRLARLLRQQRFRCTVNEAFRDVVTRCASRDDADGTWIDDEIRESYCLLHQAGHAHSVEVWAGERLAGGLYGVSLRGAFFGESMFHQVRDASKVALSCLVDRLRERGYRLLDVQWVTPHLERFGAVEIPRARYLALLEVSMRRACTFHDRDAVSSPAGPPGARTPVR